MGTDAVYSKHWVTDFHGPLQERPVATATKFVKLIQEAGLREVVQLVAVPAVTEERVVLELTVDEAAVLRQVTNNIGGKEDGFSPRGMMDNIGRALRDAGIGSTTYPRRPGMGSLYFE